MKIIALSSNCVNEDFNSIVKYRHNNDGIDQQHFVFDNNLIIDCEDHDCNINKNESYSKNKLISRINSASIDLINSVNLIITNARALFFIKSSNIKSKMTNFLNNSFISKANTCHTMYCLFLLLSIILILPSPNISIDSFHEQILSKDIYSMTTMNNNINNQKVQQQNKRILESKSYNLFSKDEKTIYKSPESLKANIMHELKNISYEKQQQNTKKINYLNNLIERDFKGSWSSNSLLPNFRLKEGNIVLSISTSKKNFQNLSEEFLLLNLNINESKYVDRWWDVQIGHSIINNNTIINYDQNKHSNQIIKNNHNDNELKIDFKDNKIRSDSFQSIFTYGEFLHRSEYQIFCEASITLNVNYINKIDIVDENEKELKKKVFFEDQTDKILSLTGKIEFNHKRCKEVGDLIIDFNVVENNFDEETLFGTRFYTAISTLLALSQIITSIWLNYKVSNNQTNAKSISLVTLGQNLIWNSYACLCNFYIALNQEKLFVYFAIPGVFFFIAFSMFDIKLVMSVWKMKNIPLLSNPEMMKKKLFRFYLSFYIFILLSAVFVTKLYFNKIYIIILTFITWVPQIYYNYQHQVRISMPLLAIFSISVNKLLIPIYFRGFSKNFFHFSSSSTLLIVVTLIMCLEVFIMYCQIVFGPRFFNFNSKNPEDMYSLYKSKEELLEIKKELYKSDCLICLNPLLNIIIIDPHNSQPANMSFNKGKNKKNLSNIKTGIENFDNRKNSLYEDFPRSHGKALHSNIMSKRNNEKNIDNKQENPNNTGGNSITNPKYLESTIEEENSNTQSIEESGYYEKYKESKISLSNLFSCIDEHPIKQFTTNSGKKITISSIPNNSNGIIKGNENSNKINSLTTEENQVIKNLDSRDTCTKVDLKEDFKEVEIITDELSEQDEKETELCPSYDKFQNNDINLNSKVDKELNEYFSNDIYQTIINNESDNELEDNADYLEKDDKEYYFSKINRHTNKNTSECLNKVDEEDKLRNCNDSNDNDIRNINNINNNAISIKSVRFSESLIKIDTEAKNDNNNDNKNNDINDVKEYSNDDENKDHSGCYYNNRNLELMNKIIAQNKSNNTKSTNYTTKSNFSNIKEDNDNKDINNIRTISNNKTSSNSIIKHSTPFPITKTNSQKKLIRQHSIKSSDTEKTSITTSTYKSNNKQYLTVDSIYDYAESKFKLSFYCVKYFFLKQFKKIFNFHESRWGRRTLFMYTRCNHAFHSECLENWLKQKQECPTCRTDIVIV